MIKSNKGLKIVEGYVRQHPEGVLVYSRICLIFVCVASNGHEKGCNFFCIFEYKHDKYLLTDSLTNISLWGQV